MPVMGLDHVNIIARDLTASVRFYADVLGLVEREPPASVAPGQGAWLCDAGGRAIVHLGSADRPGYANRLTAGPTGAIHHVALACTGYEAMVSRLEDLGIAYRASGERDLGFRQIFLTDPSDVTLELNFPD